MGIFQTGPQNPNWKGGKTVTSKGYVRIKAGEDRDKFEHRVLWEQAFGPIPDGMDVHHKNTIRTDNRLENFELKESEAHRTDALEQYKRKKRKGLPRNSR